MAFIDITGNLYGQLTVLSESLPRSEPTRWICRCSCGNTKEIIGSSMKNGSTKSCGCLHIETNKKQFTKHGDYLSKLYTVHRAMLQRCTNLNHKHFHLYGGRGISICHQWMDFLVFKQWAITHGYQESLSLERVDTNQGYSPTNCCWASKERQARNRRALEGYTSKYIGVSWDAQRKKWAACIGLHRKTIPLGRFNSEVAAAKARDIYIVNNKLEDFVLNFT